MESNKKACSIIAFVVVMLSLLTAIISDFVIFREAILAFFGGIIISIGAFIIFFAAMIVSCILIFGVYLLQQYGFWPIDLSVKFFKEVMGSIEITNQQIETFRGWRIVLLILCIFALVMAIIALHKDEIIKKKVPLKGMSVIALIFAILGIAAAIGAIAISSAIL